MLVEHPRATFLVDPAAARDMVTPIAGQQPGWVRRVLAPPAGVVPTGDALAELGPLATELDFALITRTRTTSAGCSTCPGCRSR